MQKTKNNNKDFKKALDKHYLTSLFVDFRGSLPLFSRKRAQVNVSSYTGIKQLRGYLQAKTPVQVFFYGANEQARCRYVDFISGMSSYFGADLSIGR